MIKSIYTKLMFGFFVLSLVWVASYVPLWHFHLSEFMTIYAIFELMLGLLSVFLYYKLLRYLNSQYQKNIYLPIAIVFGFLAAYGAGMHVASNQIYGQVQHPIVQYYDEFLSHAIMFLGIYGLGLVIGLWQLHAPEQVNYPELYCMMVLGILQGIIIIVGAVEASQIMLTAIFSMMASLTLLTRLYKKKLMKYPLGTYYLFYYLVLGLGSIIFF